MNDQTILRTSVTSDNLNKKKGGGRVQLSGGLLSSVLKAFHNSSLSALTPRQQYAYSTHCSRSIHFLKC